MEGSIPVPSNEPQLVASFYWGSRVAVGSRLSRDNQSALVETVMVYWYQYDTWTMVDSQLTLRNFYDSLSEVSDPHTLPSSL